jgi:exodeoxyribonuclease III
MKIVSWNVNSIRSRAGYVGQFLDEESPDVLCIQELKTTEDNVPVDLFEERGYSLAVYGQKRWNGVLVASKLPISSVELGFSGEEGGDARMIKVEVGGLQLVNLYCPQGQSADSPKFAYKKRFYGELIGWVRERLPKAERWVLTGDFNIAPDDCDVWDTEVWKGVPTFHPEEHALWQELLDCGLRDAGRPFIPDGAYSFWDYRMGRFYRNHGMRIDHFLVNPAMDSSILSAKIHRQWRKKRGELKASDHAPVELELRL